MSGDLNIRLNHAVLDSLQDSVIVYKLVDFSMSLWYYDIGSV